jgi:hypothetical protein
MPVLTSWVWQTWQSNGAVQCVTLSLTHPTRCCRANGLLRVVIWDILSSVASLLTLHSILPLYLLLTRYFFFQSEQECDIIYEPCKFGCVSANHGASRLVSYGLWCWIVSLLMYSIILVGAEDFVSQYCPDRLWGSPSLLGNGYLCSFLRVRRPEHRV